uniref:NADH-ubiquinone oxidoreductase chain 4L n=1 Tax=Macrocentrus camphoraphilus TaxID=684659 RepID=D8WHD4_9HYME|nr:NADH dehydrogenase subunit 4L [Macrocentrus camphoraphilus]
MFLTFNFSIYLMLMSTMIFTFNYKHLLIILMMLEFMMINVFFNMYLILLNFKFNMLNISIMLTIMVCESIMGLTTLIYLVRISGNDYMKSLNLMKW